MNDVLLWWVLPSLVCFILWVQLCRYAGEEEPEDYNSDGWLVIVSSSVFWPVGMGFLVIGYSLWLFPLLIKTRTFNKGE